MKRYWLLAYALTVSACGSFQKGNHAASRPEVAAPDAAADAFVVTRGEKSGLASVEIGMRKSALEKEFLLQGSMITQQQVAQFSNMKSRVVAFRAANDQVFMMEATQGHSVTKDLPQNLILAAFPVTRIDGDVIYFDFVRGLNEIPLVGDWYSHDGEDGSKYKEEYIHGHLSQSYLEDARVSADRNALVIRQVAQISAPKDLPGSMADGVAPMPTTVQMKIPMEARYYLTPYRPADDFKPSTSEDFEHYGFFEVAPQLSENGKTTVLASKFDGKAPIIFALSPNMPADVKDAVRDGVLYWNRAFGREVTRVIDAPEGRTAPDYEYNIIQWVNWDEAGYAYADAQMDPRTGQILHAQIFLTSAFAVKSKANAEKLIATLEKAPQPIAAFEVKGLGSSRLCERRMERRFASSLAGFLAEGADDARIQGAVRDHLREVVAHEVGHTLGLRHNFAGSLGASYDQIDRRSLVQSYMKDGIPADLVTTSSVMDYQLFEESIITGHQIADGAAALPYDASAIAKLYEGQATPPYAAPLFCTDSQTAEFADCKAFDTGRSPIAFRAKDPLQTMEQLPYTLAKKYTTLKAAGQTKDALRKGTTAPQELAAQLYQARAELVAFFRGDRKVLSVRRSFDYLNPLNEELVRAAEENDIEQQVREAGGIAELFAPLSHQAFGKLAQDTLHYLRLEGTMTDEDLGTLTDELQKLTEQLPLALEKEQLKYLSSLEHVRAGGLGNDFSLFLKNEAQRLLFTEKPGTSGTTVSVAAGRTVTIPTYAYDPEIRHGALKLVTAKESDPQWGALERHELKKTFNEHLEKVLGVAADDIDVDAYPREVARWIIETQQLIEAL